MDFLIWVSDLSGKLVIIHTDTCNETLVSILNFQVQKSHVFARTINFISFVP